MLHMFAEQQSAKSCVSEFPHAKKKKKKKKRKAKSKIVVSIIRTTSFGRVDSDMMDTLRTSRKIKNTPINSPLYLWGL